MTIVSNAQWTQGSGMDGGDYRCLAKVGDDLFAGSQYGGVFRSSNNGDTWMPLCNGLPAGVSVTKFMNKDTFLFAGTSYWSLTGKGVFRSNDNGNTWVPKNNGIEVSPTGYFTDLYITGFAKTSAYIYTSTYQNGIFRSSDNGDTWVSIFSAYNEDSSLFRQIYSICSIGEYLFAGGTSGLQQNGIFRSADQGATWSLFTTGFPSGCVIYEMISSNSNLFARTSHGYYWSPVNGEFWVAILNGVTTPNGAANGAISADGSVLYASTYDGSEGPRTYKSVDNGSNWVNLPTMSSYYVQALLNFGETVFAGHIGNYGISTNGGGVLRSLDGGTSWTSASTGLSGLNGMAFTSLGTTLFSGSRYYSGIYKSGDNGATWLKNYLAGTTTNYQVLSMMAANSKVFAGIYTSGVYLSSDTGHTWSATASIGYPVYALTSNSTYIFAGTSNQGVRRSSNNGTTWTTINTGLTTTGQKSIRALAANGSKIYAGTTNGVFRSANDGTNWVAANGGVGSPGYISIRSLVLKGDTILAGTTNGVVRSTNNGTTWTNVFSGSGLSTVNALILTTDTLYAGGSASGTSDGGVYFSTDWGTTWTSMNQTFPSTPEVYSLYKYNNKLFAGTYGQSVYSYDLTPSGQKTLNLVLNIEGLYSSSTGLMNKAQDCTDGAVTFDKFAGTIADTLTVMLANPTDPWETVFKAFGAPVQRDGTVSVTVPNSMTGDLYLVIRQRNSVETWSAAPVSFAGANINYNFTTAASQAFGNNQKGMAESGPYAFFSGDVTSLSGQQDGYIDIFDNNAVFNSSQGGSFGYMAEDVTGDAFVDIFDMAIVFNNMQSAAGMITPPNPGKKK